MIDALFHHGEGASPDESDCDQSKIRLDWLGNLHEQFPDARPEDGAFHTRSKIYGPMDFTSEKC